jgi:serine/threonine protein kinase
MLMGGGDSKDKYDGEPGKVIRTRYELVKMLGEGGFGQTWLAMDKDALNLRLWLHLK